MKKNRSYRSDYLFATPSFLMGAGSVLNIAGNFFAFNYASSNEQADAKAIAADWGVVGIDIEKANGEISEIKNT